MLDNEASQLLQQLMRSEKIHHQLVPPGLRRRNEAERAIRTFKNHFVAGPCTTDAKFPLNLWEDKPSAHHSEVKARVSHQPETLSLSTSTQRL